MAAILFKRFHRLNAAKENQNILEKDAPAPVLNDYICKKKSFLLHTYLSLGQDYYLANTKPEDLPFNFF